MNDYEIIMGFNLGGPTDPSHMAIAKAVEELKDYVPDASINDVVVYDEEDDAGPHGDVRGVGLDFSTQRVLSFEQVTEKLDSAESLEEISVVRD